MSRISLASALIICTLTLAVETVYGHDNEQFHADRQPVYGGPGFRSTMGGAPPIAFPSIGIELLAWLPIVRKIADFTGISAPYEAPETPELEIDTGAADVEACVDQVAAYIEAKFVQQKRDG